MLLNHLFVADIVFCAYHHKIYAFDLMYDHKTLPVIVSFIYFQVILCRNMMCNAKQISPCVQITEQQHFCWSAENLIYFIWCELYQKLLVDHDYGSYVCIDTVFMYKGIETKIQSDIRDIYRARERKSKSIKEHCYCLFLSYYIV